MKKEKKESKLGKIMKKEINININFTIIAIILIAIFCISLTPVTLQNDTFYTIKIGEYIKNNGIDMLDHFSWHENLSYTYPHWLYDLCTYLVYAISGFNGIYALTCILSAILGISIFLVNSKLTKNKAISFIVTVAAMYVLRDYIAARAQLVTFILFIWELYFIEKFIENRKIIYGLGLIIISILIANLHCATWPFFFVLFLPYIAEYLIAVISDFIIYKKANKFILKLKIRCASKNNSDSKKAENLKTKLNELDNKVLKIKIKREKENENPYKIIIKRRDNVKFLIIIMIICAFTGLLTPIGDTPYTYLYKTMQGNTTKNISEHLPMTIINNKEAMCIVIILLAILIFTKTKIRLSDLCMITGLCYLMLSTRRQLSMLTLIGSVILTRLIIDLIKRYTKNGVEKVEYAFKNYLVIFALIILMGLASYSCIKPKIDDKYINESSYPVAACDYILENMDLKNLRFYNEYNYGSYMLFRGIPVFIDSRADLYAPEFSGDKEKDIFSDFINTSGISKYYEDTFEKYDITHVILYKKSKTNMIITKSKDKNYKELYSDDNFVVYERLNVNE